MPFPVSRKVNHEDGTYSETVVATIAPSSNNIGDVDVASIAPGENYIGALGGKFASVSMTIPLPVHATYISGDYVGPSGTPILFENILRINGGSGILKGRIFDLAKQSIGGKLWLFNSLVTAPNDSAPWSISDDDILKCVGVLAFSSWDTSALNGIAISDNTLWVNGLPGSRNLYGCFVTSGAPTYASGDLIFTLDIQQD